jgi:hypothetical protein
MTIQFSKQRIAVISEGLPKMGQASFADSFVPGTILSASACDSSTSMTLNYSRASA